MKKLFFGMLVAVAGVLALPSLSAQFNQSTPTLTYPANSLAEWVLEVDFGATAHSESFNISATFTDSVGGFRIEMVDCTAAARATNTTEFGDALPVWDTNTSPPAPGTYNLVVGSSVPYATLSLSGVHRFVFTVANGTGSMPTANDITLTVDNGTAAGTSTGFTNHSWTTQPPGGGYGTIGSASQYYQRNYNGTAFAQALIGDAADSVQFDIDVQHGTTAAPLTFGVYGFAYAAGTGSTYSGNLDVDVYAMGEGFDTPVISFSIDTSTAGYAGGGGGTYTTAALSGMQTVRIIVSPGTGFSVTAGTADMRWDIAVESTETMPDALSAPTLESPPMAITPGGQAVTTTTSLTASGGSGSPSTYDWTITGAPTGVSLSATTGLSVDLQVTGTPSGSAVVRATNGATGEFTEETYTFGGGGGGMVDITTTTLPNGTEGVAGYNQNITATGGTGTHSWSISVGSLPPGLSLGTSTTGTVSITGTPTTQGTYNFTIAVSDAGTGTNDSQALTIVIDPAPTSVTITTTTLPNGTDGVAYSAQIQSTGGTGTHTWTLTAGTLPPGLSLSGSTTATETLSGTPTAANTYNFTVQVSDGSGSDTQAFTVIIAPTGGGGLTIVTTTLPSGTEGQAYSTNIGATGGTGTHTWTVSAGTLPPGLSLAGSTTGNETLSGTPTASGTYNFTIMVDDGTGNDTQAFTLVIGTSGGGGGFGTGGGGGGGGGCSAIPASTPWLLFAILGLIGTVAVMRRRKQA